MKRKTNAVGRGKEHGRGLSEAMKCLGFRLVKFPGAGTAFRNKEMEDAVFDVVQTADEASAPTKMTGQPITMSVYKLPNFTEPEDIREFHDLGEMFCWWHDMVSRKAGVRKSRKKNPVDPASLTISREEARVLSPMPLVEVKKVGPVLISPEGVKLFWSDKDGWSLYGYRSDHGDIMQAAKRAKKIAGPEQHRMNPDEKFPVVLAMTWRGFPAPKQRPRWLGDLHSKVRGRNLQVEKQTGSFTMESLRKLLTTGLDGLLQTAMKNADIFAKRDGLKQGYLISLELGVPEKHRYTGREGTVHLAHWDAWSPQWGQMHGQSLSDLRDVHQHNPETEKFILLSVETVPWGHWG